MTKFRSRLQPVFSLALLLLLGGCVTRLGVPVQGALAPDLAYAYIPLKRPLTFLPESDGGAVALGAGVAVSAAHAADLLNPASLIGISHDYDLLFFRTDRDRAVLSVATPYLGEKVIAYAHYGDVLYRAEGTVKAVEVAVKPRCDSCVVQSALAFEADAGPGYSGGPVLDAQTGKLVGIVFGYLDQPEGARLIYAYPMSRVMAELKRLQSP